MMIRGNMKNWFMLVALVFVMVVAGEVWGISAASAAAKPIKLRMMMPGEPRSAQMNPIMTAEGVGLPITGNIMESLVDVGKKGEPVPQLATKWEQRNPTTWRFSLRKGVKFHNGDNFTTRDVVEWVKWSLEEKKVSRIYQSLPIEGAIAVDDYTVDLIFKDPQPLLFTNMRYLRIIPTAITRDNRKMVETQPIGTGPYRFVEWNRGRYIKLTKFEGYWGPKPQIDDVEITFRAEETVRLSALMAGEVDWVYGLSPEQAMHAPKVARIPSPETVWLRFDEYIQKEWTGVDPIFADKRLRLAVDYAINRQTLMDVFGGFATPSLGQFASPGDFGFNSNLKSRPYDLEKARVLVREAGAVGKTLTFVGTTDRWVKDREMAEAIAYMIEQSGLKVKLMLLPQIEVSKYKNVQGENRKYKSDIVLTTTDAIMEVDTRFPFFFVEGGRFTATSDPETARLYKEVAAETDIDKRREKLAKAWAYAYEQAHYVPLFKPDWIWGIAKNLKWDMDLAGRPFFADMRFTD